MAKILNLETSTTVCSVSVAIDGAVKSVFEINEGYSHAEQLEVLIQKALVNADLKMNDLQAVSVSKGPGSYTGLRIGVSLAKGICYGANIPLISVPTLEAMALHPKVKANPSTFKIPLLDARRMEVYACVLDDRNSVKIPTAAVVIDERSFLESLEQQSCAFFGPGMEKCRDVLSVHSNACFIADILPSAAYMATVSERKFMANECEDVAYFEPFYLKDFVAGKPKKLL